MRRKEERSKQGQTNKQGKASCILGICTLLGALPIKTHVHVLMRDEKECTCIYISTRCSVESKTGELKTFICGEDQGNESTNDA